MRHIATSVLAFFLFLISTAAQDPKLSDTVKNFVRVDAPKIVLTHVRVIDGTGAGATEDQNLVIERGKISAIEKDADVASSSGATVLDLRGYTVMPGIVGMHDHLFYIAAPNLNSEWKSEPPLLVPQMTFSAPRLYLAGGVTTMRTTGSVETYADLNLKHDIDAGKLRGLTWRSPARIWKALKVSSSKCRTSPVPTMRGNSSNTGPIAA
jgi:hypothetical protein